MTDTLAQKIEKAQQDMAQWPQYKGHFANYKLARVRSRIQGKLGVSAEAGDIVIAIDQTFFRNHPNVVFYSERTKCDTGVSGWEIEFL